MSTDEMPVHPAAAVFPMLPDDELAELAEDIKANGLRHPIVRDKKGRIVDGRNRYAACKLVSVAPTFSTFEGDEDALIAFILSMNIHRRHLTEGQRAVGIVRASRFKLKRNEIDQRALAAENGVNPGRVGQAVIIVDNAPELADAVMAKSRPFSKAYEEARTIRDAKTNREKTTAAEQIKLGQIQAADPDLHLMVNEGRLSLDDALAVLRQRREDEQREQRSATQLLVTVLDFLAPPSGDLSGHVKVTAGRIKLGCVPGSERVSSGRIDHAIRFLEQLRPCIEQQEEGAADGLARSAR